MKQRNRSESRKTKPWNSPRQSRKKKKRIKNSEDILKDLCDNIKQNNILIT